MTNAERKTINEMLDASIRHFRKMPAKEKRVLDPRLVYQAFIEEAMQRLRDYPDENARTR